jgi:ribonuclease HIII
LPFPRAHMATSIPFIHNRDNAAEILKQLLREEGIVVHAEDILDNGVKLHAAYRDKSFNLVLYFSRKTGQSSSVVIEKETEEISRVVARALAASPEPTASRPSNPLLEGLRGQTHIGIDESGKGDYFGPLVIAGVCVDANDEPKLARAGVKDSKLLTDKQAILVAEKIRSIAGQAGYDVIHISPEKYNELYTRIKNLNRLLAWGHARVLENLLEKSPCDLAVCDQFGDESLIKRALMEKGKAVRLIQSPRAEQDTAVAAASILARDTFLRKLDEMSQKYGVRFPKGATHVLQPAREFVTGHDRSELGKVAKLHFKTTEKVLKGT